MAPPTSVNFGFLKAHSELLVSLGALAERYFSSDPPTALIKLRLFGEALLKHTAAAANSPAGREEPQAQLIQRMKREGLLPNETGELFHLIREKGNAAAHEGVGSAGDALHCLKAARTLGIWFHRGFGKQPNFAPGPFVPIAPALDAASAQQSELALKKLLDAERLSGEQARAAAAEVAREKRDLEQRIRQSEDDAKQWEQIAREYEQKLTANLAAVTKKAAAQEPEQLQMLVADLAAAGNALDLDEADTRALIDQQLENAGWKADSQLLHYAAGTRPMKGENRAIAEWPTKNGPADYALFIGLKLVGVVEAKRKRKDVSGSLEQALRYSEGFDGADVQLVDGSPWGKVRAPFLLATNGRPYLKQLETKSGIWFRDARKKTNLGRALSAWPTPQGLGELLQQDVAAAEQRLKDQPVDQLPDLRPYQQEAIAQVEGALAKGKRTVLVAMATGTGKTRTFIGLIYRLVKTGRFRRVLFLVDRNALGDQASTEFETRAVEGNRPFSDIFTVAGMKDLKPQPETKLHFATVQAVAKRLFDGKDGKPELQVDDYDCIVIDECHRGYTLDREMSDSELSFRDQTDYLSVYRRVVEYFDAVKIGLTATPALHTTEIFGRPVFEYSYRQAVLEHYLVDQEPPIRIATQLSTKGIKFKKGEQVSAYKAEKGQLDLMTLPDELGFDVDAFNKQVVTENFNRVVAEELAKQIDPSLPGKTLVFAANDAHADTLVKLLLAAFEKQYGSVDAGAVKKITGAADKPALRLREFKNERNPSVAVTVDLLTTGVDVPSICNLVFVRQVRSRILYEQMIGRATRLYTSGDFVKESYRIFDAVDLYSKLEPFTSMKPVVKDPALSFASLVADLQKAPGADAKAEVLEQLVAKLQRKQHLFDGGRGTDRFEAAAGLTFKEVVEQLRTDSAKAATTWLLQHQPLVALLDLLTAGPAPVYVSEHEDAVLSVTQGFGEGRVRPEDYLTGFKQFLDENASKLPALMMVTKRPKELTRSELMKLKLALDQAGYSETQLRAAYKATTNVDVAASVMGYVRQRALGEPLKPYAQRVDEAVARLLASRKWSDPQAKWIRRIGKAIKENEVVDRPLFDEGAFATDGGWSRADRVFEGRLDVVLAEIQDRMWGTT